MIDALEKLTAFSVMAAARLITGVRPQWQQRPPLPGEPVVYIANHSSHGDFVLIWTVLPAILRAQTRPVAGADYWRQGRLRPFIAENVLRAVLIERGGAALTRAASPVGQLADVLDLDQSLILFPEGTRNTGSEPLLPFKSGIYHLARARPQTRFVPVWIDNVSRVLPKGDFLPIPLLCSVTFGGALTWREGEAKQQFLNRAREAILSLTPARRARPEAATP